MEYGYLRRVGTGFKETIEKTREALKAEGFGVLSEIDIRAKMEEKLGVDFRNYVILGACNPPIAYEALRQEINLGLLLPCNVIVYEEDGQTVVGAVDAAKMLSVTGNSNLSAAAEVVNEKLRRAIDSV